MDGHRFDALTRALATRRSRRRALLSGGGAVIAAVAAVTRPPSVTAGKQCDPFNNTCPIDADGRCQCAQTIEGRFACADHFDACRPGDLCQSSRECRKRVGRGSTCLACDVSESGTIYNCSNPCVSA
jgi:hypothetical protein